MVNRGRAVVVKKDNSKWRDAWINSAGEETSPPTTEEDENKKARKRKPKLSSEAPSLPQADIERQEPQHREQSAARGIPLAHLFDDFLPDASDLPVPSVESGPVRHAPTLPTSPPEQHAQAAQDADRQTNDSSTPTSDQATRSQKDAPPKSRATLQPKTRRAHLPTPESGTASRRPSTASVEQLIEQPADTDDMANTFNNSVPPNQFKNLRACMVCSIVKTMQQFVNHGCPNCHFLELRGSQDATMECTSQVFEGLITVSDTHKSWVARWQRLEGYVPGVYAVQVEGVLPDDMVGAAEEAGIHYIPRDGSVNEALPTDA